MWESAHMCTFTAPDNVNRQNKNPKYPPKPQKWKLTNTHPLQSFPMAKYEPKAGKNNQNLILIVGLNENDPNPKLVCFSIGSRWHIFSPTYTYSNSTLWVGFRKGMTLEGTFFYPTNPSRLMCWVSHTTHGQRGDGVRSQFPHWHGPAYLGNGHIFRGAPPVYSIVHFSQIVVRPSSSFIVTSV